MTKYATVIASIVLGVLLPGCASVEKALNNLPQISAEQISLASNNPLGGLQVDATNLVQTPERATADSLTVQISTPFIGTTTVAVKGYSRAKKLDH